MTNYFPYVALNATNLVSAPEELTSAPEELTPAPEETTAAECGCSANCICKQTEEITTAGERFEPFFKPEGFVGSLQYMGKGMLGILIVMGAIIIATTVLNAISSRKKKKDGSEEE